MTFLAGMVRGAGGVVDHRMARRALLNEYRRGRVSRDDLCDAHPELVRAAVHHGEKSSRTCEVCAEADVVLVTYAFGPGLPSNGRLIVDRNDVARLTRTGRDYTAYVVEVCPGCRWHHLLRALPVPGTRPGRLAR